MKGTVAAVWTVLASSVPLGTGAWAQAGDPVRTWPQADPSDEIGASRTQRPAKVLQAIRLVSSGHVYRLAHDDDETNIPQPFGREFDVTVLSGDLGVVPSQAFGVGVVTGRIGQLGTRFDGVGHAGRTFGFYNRNPPEDVGPDPFGRLQKLGAPKPSSRSSRARSRSISCIAPACRKWWSTARPCSSTPTSSHWATYGK